MCLLAQIYPRISPEDKTSETLRKQARKHSDELCGILIHTKDKAVFSVTMQCLDVAADALLVRAKQEEIMALFEKIRRECGWRSEYYKKELQMEWGWSSAEAPAPKEVKGTSKFDSSRSKTILVNIPKESSQKGSLPSTFRTQSPLICVVAPLLCLSIEYSWWMFSIRSVSF
jgi:hypothetical protein